MFPDIEQFVVCNQPAPDVIDFCYRFEPKKAMIVYNPGIGYMLYSKDIKQLIKDPDLIRVLQAFFRDVRPMWSRILNTAEKNRLDEQVSFRSLFEPAVSDTPISEMPKAGVTPR